MNRNDTLVLPSMEFSTTGVTEIIAAVTALVGGVFGGLKIGKSKQVEEIKELITQYKDANEFTKEEAAELRLGIKELREENHTVQSKVTELKHLHELCEESKVKLSEKVACLEGDVCDLKGRLDLP